MAIRVSNFTGQYILNPDTHNVSVVHSLGLTQETRPRTIRMKNFTAQILWSGGAVSPTPINDIEFNQVVFHYLAIGERQVPSHDLGLTQTVNTPGFDHVSHDLGLVQTLSYVGPKLENINQSVSIHGVAVGVLGVPWIPFDIEHDLSLTQTVGRAYQENVLQALGITHDMFRGFHITHDLNFIQSFDVGKGIDFIQALGIDHSIINAGIFGRAIAHSSILQDAAAYYFDGPCPRKTYNRFEGSGDSPGIPIKPFTFDAIFTLQTLTGAKEVLELRNPETDDRRRIGFTRVNRETRGGEINVFSDSIWPKVETLLFTIVALGDGKGGCPDKVNALMDFFQNNLGREILLHDWEGVTWKGVVTTPNEVATEDQDGWWTVSFEFEGVELTGSPTDHNFNVQQSVALNMERLRGPSHNLDLVQVVEVSGILNESVVQSLGITQVVSGLQETVILDDNFSGLVSAELHGTSPDTGSSTWSSHSSYKADGSQVGVASGAYYPFVPTNGTIYHIEWEPRSITESDALETTFFLGEGLNADPDNIGYTAYGQADPTTLKAGFVIKKIGVTQNNSYRLGNTTDGKATTQEFSDATLRTEEDEIDLRLILDTTGNTNNWTAEWFAKDILDSTWTLVGTQQGLLAEDITMVGWSNDNVTTTVVMNNINITEKVSF